MCRLEPETFAKRRGESPAKKKIRPTEPAPGPLTSLALDPPRPLGLRKQQQSQRGKGNNRARTNRRAGRGGRGGNVTQQEGVSEGGVASRRGSFFKPWKTYSS